MSRCVGFAWMLSLAVAAGCSDDTAPAASGGDAGVEQDGGGLDHGDAATGPHDADVADAMRDAFTDRETDAGAADASVAADAATDDAGGDAGTSELTLIEYCPELRDAACEWWKSCNDVDDCELSPVSFIAHLCDNAEALVDAVVVDPDRAMPCLELHTPVADAASCPRSPPPLLSGYNLGPVAGDNACTGVLRSTGRLGDDCFPDDVRFLDGCGEGYCERDLQCPGTCTAFAAEGESCVDTRCDADLYCGPDDTCVAYAGVGDSCSGTARCGRHLYCDASEACAMRTAEGGACDVSVATCATGLQCGALEAGEEAGMCVQPRGLGGACRIDAGCSYPLRCVDNACSDALAAPGGACVGAEQCPAGYNCHNGGNGPFTCITAKADGEACDYHAECVRDHVCSAIPADATFRCYAMGQVGDPCGPRGCDDFLYCDAGTCAANSGEGGACDRDLGNCQQGLGCMDNGECHPIGDAIGDPCTVSEPDTCVDGLFCHPSNATCASPVGDGEICNPSDNGNSCQAGLYCKEPASSTADATCAALIPVGSACQGQGQGCEAGSQCDQGTCVLIACTGLDP